MARGFSRGGGGGGRSGGSGGGFSRGGGFSSRSSSSWSSSSSSYGGGGYHHTPRPRRPWNIPMFGRTVVVTTRAQSIFSLFIMIILFASVMCYYSAKSASYYTHDIKKQQEKVLYRETRDKDYMTLINGAKAGIYEIQEFDITPYYNESTQSFKYEKYYNEDNPELGIYDMDFYHNGQEYFFIEFSYNSGADKDFTFTQYTEYQLKDIIRNGGKIKIAVGNLTNTASKDDGTYAINMDYSLEANQEYQYEVYTLKNLKSQRTSKILTAVGFGAVDLLIVGGIVLYVVKKYKLAKKQTDAEVAKTEAETKLAEEQAKQINRTCSYCGANVPDGEDACPACGSRYFEDK